MKLFSVIFILLASVPITWAQNDIRTTLQFGEISVGSLLDEEVDHGCGCSLHHPIEKKEQGFILLQWEYNESATIFVNGKLCRLPSDGANIGYSSSIGEYRNAELRSNEIVLDVTLRSTWICPNDAESCEVTEYEGTLGIRVAGTQTIIPVWASCGC